jgi:hypothetical protein
VIPRAWLAGIAATLLLGGGGVAFVLFQQHAAREEQIEQIRSSVQLELERERRDTGAMQAELRRVVAARRDADDPRLLLLEAKLLLALGRVQQAWDVVGNLALATAGPAEALDVGARVLEAWHAQSGDPAKAEQAFALAEQHAQRTGSAESAFRAWQCAHRAGRPRDAGRLAEALAQEHADTLHGRLVAKLARFDPEASRGEADELLRLEREFVEPPPELTIARALLVLADPGDVDLRGAVDTLERLLDRMPALLEARAAIVIGHHRLGATADRDHHLRWLLQHAPEQDARRETWARLLQGD